ncbi:MAG TPA: glycosyltransferase [Paludibacter sp.]|nr:glycosyltransferase [Paludibacter sp.]
MANAIFSIIIPVYNVEPYLQSCLDSVLNQSFSSCELICINDGSTDGSLAILEEYAQKYPKQVKVFSQLNLGLSATRNKGVEMAGGDYLLFLDSDDTLTESSLSRLAMEVNDKTIDIVAFNSELYFESDKRSEDNIKFNHTENQLFTKGMDYFDAFVAKRCWGPSAVCFYLFKRKLLIENKLEFEVGLLHEDELFMPQVLFYGQKIRVINDVLYSYRIHGESITRTQKRKNYTDKLQIAEMLFDFFADKKMLDKSVQRSIYNLSLAGIHGLMSTGSGRAKISLRSRTNLVSVAQTIKEKMIAIMIRLDVRLYRLYFKIIK